MFAFQTKKTIEFEDGSVTIHKLSWRRLEEARRAKSADQASSMRSVGGEVLQVLRSEAIEDLKKKLEERKADPEQKKKARYAEYDRGTLFVKAIESWTYGELNPATIDELPEDQAERLHEEILDLSLPPLEPEKAEVEGKDASVPSTST